MMRINGWEYLIIKQIMQNQIEEVKTYIEQQEKETPLWQIDQNLESLGLDVKISSWLKNDETLLSYAQVFLKENQTIWEKIKMPFLELKAKILCPYFDEFKTFLAELKEWQNATQDQTVEQIDDTHEFCWTKVSEIESQPYYKNSYTGVTRCSATAQFNWSDFWLTLPSWDAYDAGTKPWDLDQYQKTVPSSKVNKKPESIRSKLDVSEFNVDEDINFADIYTSSSSDYGHRAVAFKDSTGQWYVLDPYTRVNWVLDNSPKKLEDYMQNRDILKSHFYQSSYYSPESREYNA